jgi:hypothetical protein
MKEDKKLDKLLEIFEEKNYPIKYDRHYKVSGGDRALLILLDRYRDELPSVDEYFHKAFRQVDVIEDGEGSLDMAIWHLIGDSKLFWDAWEEMEKHFSS